MAEDDPNGYIVKREVLDCRRRGVKVRLIVDYSNIGNTGCQVQYRL